MSYERLSESDAKDRIIWTMQLLTVTLTCDADTRLSVVDQARFLTNVTIFDSALISFNPEMLITTMHSR